MVEKYEFVTDRILVITVLLFLELLSQLEMLLSILSLQVEAVEALQWANNEKVRLAEVSSLDRHSLYEPFMYLASKLNPPPNKSALATITSTIKRERNKSELD